LGSQGSGEGFTGHGDVDGGGFVKGHFGIHLGSEMAGVLVLGEVGEALVGRGEFCGGSGGRLGSRRGRGTGEPAAASDRGGSRWGGGQGEGKGRGRCRERGRRGFGDRRGNPRS
jgi:hypothetical protein